MKTPTLNLRPATMADFPALIEASECWTHSFWDRRRGPEITIYHDDVVADRRLVFRLQVPPQPSNPRYEVTRLSGYDPEKNCWTKHHGSYGPVYLPDRKGWKALQAALTTKAKEAGRYGLGTLYTHYNR